MPTHRTWLLGKPSSSTSSFYRGKNRDTGELGDYLKVHLVGNGKTWRDTQVSQFLIQYFLYYPMLLPRNQRQWHHMTSDRKRANLRKMVKIKLMAKQLWAVIMAKGKLCSRKLGTNVHYSNKSIFKDFYRATTFIVNLS